MKGFFMATFCSFALVLTSFEPVNPKKYTIDTIVIDPGHGGNDSGCRSNGIFEKDVVLAIGLKLGKIIKDNLPGVEVIYTRKKDKFLELWERAKIANKNKADVFISLHCNASSASYVKGTETFCMGIHKSEENLKVAKRENSVVLMEDNYKERYDGFDPTSPEGHIIFSLNQDANLQQSLKLASKIQHQFKERVSRKNRGVKQAGFVVLWKTTMPSVLIEAGFLTNPHERKYLTSELGQTYIASGIFRAVRNYKEAMEGKPQE
ncbi:MAG: N-acetylmuramoyl-L-alanine amidase [Bacteroidetes bacterium SW_10_40_5]|nr:MAG: N-acetylmuramoyl-L-alanine amidase [Bacteroidetes bacterium SW_10_40_5]